MVGEGKREDCKPILTASTANHLKVSRTVTLELFMRIIAHLRDKNTIKDLAIVRSWLAVLEALSDGS